MAKRESSLAHAERHVREAEEQVLRIVNIIAELRNAGREQTADEASNVLAAVTRSLELARDHLRAERLASTVRR